MKCKKCKNELSIETDADLSMDTPMADMICVTVGCDQCGSEYKAYCPFPTGFYSIYPEDQDNQD